MSRSKGIIRRVLDSIGMSTTSYSRVPPTKNYPKMPNAKPSAMPSEANPAKQTPSAIDTNPPKVKVQKDSIY